VEASCRYYCNVNREPLVTPEDLAGIVPVADGPRARAIVGRAQLSGFLADQDGRPEALWTLAIGGRELHDVFVLRGGEFLSLREAGR
jgi:hypothetical protein